MPLHMHTAVSTLLSASSTRRAIDRVEARLHLSASYYGLLSSTKQGGRLVLGYPKQERQLLFSKSYRKETLALPIPLFVEWFPETVV